MARYSPSKLTKKDKEALLVEFCQAMTVIKSPVEAAHFIQDLLTSQEAEMLAKRIRIAKMLLSGLTYNEIKQDLKVGKSTVARVSEWLRESGAGFRMVIERTKSVPPSPIKEAAAESWTMMKRRYPLHLWPEVLIEEIVRGATGRKKERIINVLDSLKEKDLIFQELRLKMATDFRESKKGKSF